MLKLQRIHTADKELYNFMEELMKLSFPPEEYRDLEQLREYADTKDNFYCNVILEDNTPVGFFNYWDFDTFYYGEHFAIAPQMRNGGRGKVVLQHLCDTLQRPFVLEVEMPDEPMAIRRIGFYERQGFTLWPNDYRQPPYKQGDSFLPMRLMSYGDLDNVRDYERVKSLIHREVYGVQDGH